MALISSAALWLVEVADEGSIRRAGLKLNVAPSAINRQIIKLEGECGTFLFERQPRGVRLTAAGEILVAGIRRWRDEQCHMRRLMDESLGLSLGHVSVGIMESIAPGLALRLIEKFSTDRPGVTFTIRTGGTAELAKALIDGQLNLALCFSAPATPKIQVLAHIVQYSGIACSPDHPLAGRQSVTLADCDGCSIVMPDHSLSSHQRFHDALERAGIKPAMIATTNSIAVMKALVEEGGQIAFLGIADIHREVARGNLVHLPLVDQSLTASSLSLLARSGVPSPIVARTAAFIAHELETLPPASQMAHGA